MGKRFKQKLTLGGLSVYLLLFGASILPLFVGPGAQYHFAGNMSNTEEVAFKLGIPATILSVLCVLIHVTSTVFCTQAGAALCFKGSEHQLLKKIQAHENSMPDNQPILKEVITDPDSTKTDERGDHNGLSQPLLR